MESARKKTSKKASATGNPAVQRGVVPAKSTGVPSAESGEVVKFSEAGMPQLEVWLEDETIWLTQRQMSVLFGCAPQNITYHLREIFKIGELSELATCKEFLQVQIEGGRRIGKLEKRMTAAERSIDTIIYTLMPSLPENRKPIGFDQ